MKIFITGGAGLVGSHCAQHYAADKRNKVVVYDNLMRSRIFGVPTHSVEYNWKFLKAFKNVTLIRADIRQRAVLEKSLRAFRPDAVIHAAGQPGVGFSLNDPCEDASINAQGTLNVLEALRGCNPKAAFVYCSTNKVYGDNVNGFPLRSSQWRYSFRDLKGIPETCSIDHCGHTPYGVSKLTGDLYVQDAAQSFGLRTGVFRMSCIYGTRQFGFEDQGWIAWFAIRFLRGEPITIFGDGRQVRDVLWVGDLVRAFDAFIRSSTPANVLNMGGGPDNTLSLLELVVLLKELTGKSVKISFKDWRKFDQKVYISDVRKAARILGWKPQVTPREGVARVVRWLEENRKIFTS